MHNAQACRAKHPGCMFDYLAEGSLFLEKVSRDLCFKGVAIVLFLKYPNTSENDDSYRDHRPIRLDAYDGEHVLLHQTPETTTATMIAVLSCPIPMTLCNLPCPTSRNDGSLRG